MHQRVTSIVNNYQLCVGGIWSHLLDSRKSLKFSVSEGVHLSFSVHELMLKLNLNEPRSKTVHEFYLNMHQRATQLGLMLIVTQLERYPPIG